MHFSILQTKIILSLSLCLLATNLVSKIRKFSAYHEIVMKYEEPKEHIRTSKEERKETPVTNLSYFYQCPAI